MQLSFLRCNDSAVPNHSVSIKIQRNHYVSTVRKRSIHKCRTIFIAENIPNHIRHGIPAFAVIIGIVYLITFRIGPCNKDAALVLYIGVAIQFRLPFLRRTCLEQRSHTEIKNIVDNTEVLCRIGCMDYRRSQ